MTEDQEWVRLWIKWDDEHVWEGLEHVCKLQWEPLRDGAELGQGEGPKAAPRQQAQGQWPLLLLSSLPALATQGEGGGGGKLSPRDLALGLPGCSQLPGVAR